MLALTLALAACAAAMPASAAACSCAPLEPRERLADGEPAFTGRVVARQRNAEAPGFAGADTFTYTFRVGHSFNRKPRRRLVLTAGTQSASCGVLLRKGARVGAFVYRSGAGLTTNACSLVDPDALIRAGRRVSGQNAGSVRPCRPAADTRR